VAIQRRRERRAKKEPPSLSRERLMKLTAEALIETLDKGDSNPAQRQQMIDELDEINDYYDA
jgi:hypothetical protein